MNIAVINAKDLFKNIFKFLTVICIILFLVKGLKNIGRVSQEEMLKQAIENTASNVNSYSFLKCLDLSISLMSYTKTNEKSEENFFTNEKILAMTSGIFEQSIYEKSGLVINERDLSTDDIEELSNQIADLPDNVTVESVNENNITPKVTTSYGNVEINNQSDYELTEDMLVPDVEITNKKDILIYHTHTCESYTTSPRI